MNGMSQRGKLHSWCYPVLTFLLALQSLCLAGCASPAWYAQAVSGHVRLMNDREDITAILESGKADMVLARELELSIEIRQFAVSKLFLPDNGSYTQYVRTGRDAVTWNVIAAPQFSLKPRRWCFIVSGCVPYRGYFEQAEAERLANKLRARGYDTAISPAVAYSTLGWFDDPLLDTMFQYSNDQLAAFIFHELAHQKLYVRGDAAFNEAYASFVEEEGVRLWLRSRGYLERLEAWQERQIASARLNALVSATRRKLRQLYSSGLPEERMRTEKFIIIGEMQDAYRALAESEWGGIQYFQSVLSPDMNNARLALIYSYQGGICAFEILYRASGGRMDRFQELARDKAAMPAKERSAWLAQSCAAVASKGNL